jgi:hypothetical protein
LACLCGHASFEVTAANYVHLFPWLAAAALDRSRRLAPEVRLLKLSSGLPDTTFRRWLQSGGVHNIALELFKRGRLPGESDSDFKEGTRQDFASEAWIETDWNYLLRKLTSGSELILQSSTESEMIARATQLLEMKSDGGVFRHPMEIWMPDRREPLVKQRLACPLRPRHLKNVPGAKLIGALQTMASGNPSLLKRALQSFSLRVQRGAFVRFDGLSELAEANLYIEFLRGLGLKKRQIELVSGDPDPDSPYIKLWKDRLSELYMRITPCKMSRNYGPKSALSVRPCSSADAGLRTGNAGFRFAMAMAYVRFGGNH